MIWLTYAIILVLFLILGGIVYFNPSLFFTQKTVSNIGPYDLSILTTPFDNSNVKIYESSGAMTVQGFFYIIPLQRTPTAMSCNTPGNPSCEDGRFHTCTCVSNTDCINCKSNGYLDLLKVGDTVALEILPAPDAGRQGKAMTQLAIRTQTNVDSSGNAVDIVPRKKLSKVYTEYLSLPPIPLQKWCLVTIVREGRRFDVYYDNTLVLSKKTSYVLSTTEDTTKGVTVGGPGFTGYMASAKFIQSALTGSEVFAQYSNETDTRGAPFVKIPEKTITQANDTFGFKIPSLCLIGCGPKVMPSKPLMEWETQYA
uniref:Uncharacterized protein n=1 Tax=viral metagenome TaxID=1070528 RepID=A0A6C0BB85_9ZZZZ